jgi:hypothetical protein
MVREIADRTYRVGNAPTANPFLLSLPQSEVDKIPVICDKSRVSFYIVRKLNYLFK